MAENYFNAALFKYLPSTAGLCVPIAQNQWLPAFRMTMLTSPDFEMMSICPAMVAKRPTGIFARRLLHATSTTGRDFAD